MLYICLDVVCYLQILAATLSKSVIDFYFICRCSFSASEGGPSAYLSLSNRDVISLSNGTNNFTTDNMVQGQQVGRITLPALACFSAPIMN